MSSKCDNTNQIENKILSIVKIYVEGEKDLTASFKYIKDFKSYMGVNYLLLLRKLPKLGKVK